MTNEKYIRELPIEELAKLLLKEVVIYDYEEHGDDIMTTEKPYICTSDDMLFDPNYQKDDAVRHEIKWLKKARTA